MTVVLLSISDYIYISRYTMYLNYITALQHTQHWQLHTNKYTVSHVTSHYLIKRALTTVGVHHFLDTSSIDGSTPVS